MEREVALVALGDKVAAASRPVLSQDSLGALLDQFQVEDRDGRAPSDPEWAGAWNLNAAAAEGWRIKAGKVAGDFNFSADGASYNKADVLAQCLEMEQRYAALTGGSLVVGPERPRLPRDWDGTQVP